MNSFLAGVSGVSLCALVATQVPTSTRQQVPVSDPAQAQVRAGAARLYDTSILHRIDITIAPEDVSKIPLRTNERIRSTFTIDDVTLKDVGVRQSGGVYHAYVPISGKPSLSIKFDEFVRGQRVFGLDKLILKNELQDVSFVSEHLSYQIFRNAGLAAPLTAHAHVRINGIDSGIYLMREPIDRSFLVRNFGKGFESGNLYEIENTQDFVLNPTYATLDDEGENGRTRQRFVEFAGVVAATTPETFVKDVSPYVDVNRLVTYVAVEVATSHWDGLTFSNNNTYVYAHPRDGRFIFIPWGADQTVFAGRSRRTGWPRSSLVQKMLQVPALAVRVQSEVTQIGREPIWNQKQLTQRLDAVAKILAGVDLAGRTSYDLQRFAAYRPYVESVIGGGASQ